MHRALSHQGSKLPAPIELQGRSVKQSPTKHKGSLGRWDNLLSGSQERVKSPQAVAKRWEDNIYASRTMHPELNNDEVYHKTRKITHKETSSQPGNLLELFKRTGTIDNVYPSKKKYFKEYEQTEQLMTPKPERRIVRPSERKTDDMCSHIPTLASPTFVDKEKECKEIGHTSACSSPTFKKKQDFLKSAISALPGSEDTKRPFQDRDETKIIQSNVNPRVARHLATTLQDQPLFAASPKKDPNKQSITTYEDESRLNPLTKGKKVAYPQYTEKVADTPFPENGGVYSNRAGGMEPIDLMYVGRRSIAPKPATNIYCPPEEKVVPRGQTMFSYRTFASQIPF